MGFVPLTLLVIAGRALTFRTFRSERARPATRLDEPPRPAGQLPPPSPAPQQVLASYLKTIGFIIPLMDAEHAFYYTREVMLVLKREFATPDEEMKKIVLKARGSRDLGDLWEDLGGGSEGGFGP